MVFWYLESSRTNVEYVFRRSDLGVFKGGGLIMSVVSAQKARMKKSETPSMYESCLGP